MEREDIDKYFSWPCGCVCLSETLIFTCSCTVCMCSTECLTILAWDMWLYRYEYYLLEKFNGSIVKMCVWVFECVCVCVRGYKNKR